MFGRQVYLAFVSCHFYLEDPIEPENSGGVMTVVFEPLSLKSLWRAWRTLLSAWTNNRALPCEGVFIHIAHQGYEEQEPFDIQTLL